MFIDRCRLVRESLDNPAITTDIIVGFPGETEADFEATCRVSRECGFSKIHIFPFSPRKGTPAAEMTDMVAAAGQKRALPAAGGRRTRAARPTISGRSLGGD